MYCVGNFALPVFTSFEIKPGPTISFHRMCFPGHFPCQSQQQPKAPVLSVDILCSPGPWGDRHHLPSQDNPLWLFCDGTKRTREQMKPAGHNPPWCLPSTPLGLTLARAFGWQNSWIGIVQWSNTNKKYALFQEVAPNLVRVKLGKKKLNPEEFVFTNAHGQQK